MQVNPMEELAAQNEERCDEPGVANRVILVQLAEDPFVRELSLELALRGHSLALWRGAPGAPRPDDEALLVLQLAIERAGGISLADGWAGGDPVAGSISAEKARTSFGWAIDAFGRIDAAVAWGREGAAALSRGLNALKASVPRFRLPLLLILAGDESSTDDLQKVSPGAASGLEGASRAACILQLGLKGAAPDGSLLREKVQAAADALGAASPPFQNPSPND